VMRPLAVAFAVLLGLNAPAAAAEETPAPLAAFPDALDLGPLRNVAVQDGGRRKPLDTFAREKVKLILGTERHGTQDPLETLLSMVFETERWEPVEAIKIQNLRLVELFGKTKNVARLSFAEINTNPKLQKAIEALDPDDKMRGPFDTALLELQHRRLYFYSLARALRVAPVPNAPPREAWSSIVELTGQPPAIRDVVLDRYRDLGNAWRAGDAKAVNEGVRSLAARLAEVQGPLAPPTWKLRLETTINMYHPLQIAYAVLIGAALLMGTSIVTRGRASYIAGSSLLSLGLALSAGALTARTIIVERAPVGNLYEAASFAVVMAVIVGSIFEVVYRNGVFGTCGAVFGALGTLLIDLAGMDVSIQPLVPVLRSYWLNIHVTAMLTSYATFAIAFLLGIYYFAKWFPSSGYSRGMIVVPVATALAGVGLLFYRNYTVVMPTLWDYLFALVLAPGAGIGLTYIYTLIRPPAKPGYESELELKTIERYLHRVCMVGFWIITGGIILGAVWANESWGRYWGWDPKETWAFITWLVYAIYVHGRIPGWFRGAAAAIFPVVGFYAVLFTFFGVSFVLPGLHSYLKS
jgi:cytochrome c-type biogenesis protein CcsB